MKELTKKDKDIAKEIQENMFDFENLIGIDDKSMQTLIRSLDNELIVVALKEQMMQFQINFLLVCHKEQQLILKMKWKHLVL